MTSEALFDMIDTGANAIAGLISDVIETLGNATQDGASAMAASDLAAPATPALQWVGGVVSATCDLVAGIVSGGVCALAGLGTGVVRLGVGAFRGNARGIRSGVDTILSGLISGVCILPLGKLVAFLQSAIPGAQNQKRRLSTGEIAILKRIYHSALDLYNVRVVDGFAGVFSVNARPFVLGNVIYLKGGSEQTFVHESVHIWQFQKEGATYLGLALAAEMRRKWFGGVSYCWEDEIAGGVVEWKNFNKEAQASFVEDLYIRGTATVNDACSSGPGDCFSTDPFGNDGRFVFNDIDHSRRAAKAVHAIRNAFSLRMSSCIAV